MKDNGYTNEDENGNNMTMYTPHCYNCKAEIHNGEKCSFCSLDGHVISSSDKACKYYIKSDSIFELLQNIADRCAATMPELEES
jgi:hypothetical protein